MGCSGRLWYTRPKVAVDSGAIKGDENMGTLLVLDFDGTMTDAEVEGVPFRQGYLEDVSILSGLPIEDVERMAETFSEEVWRNAHAYGWDFGGRIVAPAVVDPYLRMMPVARKILDEAGAFTDRAERNRLLADKDKKQLLDFSNAEVNFQAPYSCAAGAPPPIRPQIHRDLACARVWCGA